MKPCAQRGDSCAEIQRDMCDRDPKSCLINFSCNAGRADIVPWSFHQGIKTSKMGHTVMSWVFCMCNYRFSLVFLALPFLLVSSKEQHNLIRFSQARQHVARSRWACLCRLFHDGTCSSVLCLLFCCTLQMDQHMVKILQQDICMWPKSVTSAPPCKRIIPKDIVTFPFE